jgi:hypothetical protein
MQTNTHNHSSTIICVAKNALFAEITFKGGITREVLDDSFRALIKESHFKFNMNAVYDYSDAYSDIDMPAIQEHSQFVADHLELRGRDYKLALVASDTLTNALLSVYKLLISKTSVEAEVFSTKANAIRWLTEEAN